MPLSELSPKKVMFKGQEPSLPENYNKKDSNYFKPHFDYNLFQPAIVTIKFALLVKSGVVLNLLLKPFKVTLPWQNWADSFSKSYWLGKVFKALLKANVELKLRSTEEVVVFNVFSDNYFHWITEVLPKINYVKNLNPNSVFLFPYSYNSDYQLQTLKILDVKVRYFKSELLFFTRLFFISAFSEYPGYYLPNSLKVVRSSILSEIGRTDCSKAHFVYVSRKKASRRKVINESEIEPILIKHNFQIFYFEELSFIEIVEISRTAKILVSIHGAALTNMIFMEKNSIVFELLKENVVIDKCYFLLSNALELTYYYQTCLALNPDDSHIFADIIVDTNLFGNNLKLITESLSKK